MYTNIIFKPKQKKNLQRKVKEMLSDLYGHFSSLAQALNSLLSLG